MPPARTDGVTYPSGRIGQQGPSLSAVLSLNVSKPPTLMSGMSPRPQPPLQRIRRPMVGSVVPREEVECTLSHIKQLRQKEREQKREARDSRREYRKNMRDLVDSFEGGLEETAARSVWARDISSQQEEQRVSKVRRDIEDHRFFYSEDNFFPFESKQGKPGIYDSPAVHRDKLLLQAEEDRRRDALRLMVEGVKDRTATGILASSLPAEIPRGVASVAAAHPRQEAEHRNATRRAVEQRLKMVQQQQQKERFNARMIDNLERKEREDAHHERRNQKQLEKAHIMIEYSTVRGCTTPCVCLRIPCQLLSSPSAGCSPSNPSRTPKPLTPTISARQVLSLQAADKAGRDLRDHVKLFGEHGSILPAEGWDRAHAVHVAKQALQDQIDEKQRERKALKRAERARVRQYNDANERHTAALDAQESSALQHQRAELKLAWAKQEGALRAQRRGEARRSDAHMRMQDGLSKLTGDPNMKITQGA